ncbi:hypothetical protein FGB62_43g014 [Gracilaria domingensis]|nr:hypothetical protein FGB62_43g014 [Gracilaria domingensis]
MPAPPPSLSLPAAAPATPLGELELRVLHGPVDHRRGIYQYGIDHSAVPTHGQRRPLALIIHGSLMRAASPTLGGIIPDDVRTPARIIELLDRFSLIRKFLYLQPIDLAAAPVDLPLSAA